MCQFPTLDSIGRAARQSALTRNFAGLATCLVEHHKKEIEPGQKRVWQADVFLERGVQDTVGAL